MGRAKATKTSTVERRTKAPAVKTSSVRKKNKTEKRTRKKAPAVAVLEEEALAETEVPYLAPPVRVEQPSLETLLGTDNPNYVDYNPNGIKSAEELISALQDTAHPYPHLVLAEEIFTDSDIVISRDVTLDLNGHNLIATRSGSQALQIKSGNVVLTGGGKESRIFAEAPGSLAVRIYGSSNALVTEHARVTIDRDVTLFASGSYGVLVRANVNACYGVVLNLRGRIIARDGIAIHENVQNVQGAPIMNIEDGAEIAAEYTAIRSDGYSIWHIGNVELTGNYGLSMRAGVANLNNTQIATSGLDLGEKDAAMINNHGGDFEALLSAVRDPEALAEINAMLGGGAIKIENHPQYSNSIAVTIDGGSYVSRSGYVFFEDNCRAAPQQLAHSALRDFTILGGQFSGALGAFSPGLSEIVQIEDGKFLDLPAEQQQLVQLETRPELYGYRDPEFAPQNNLYWNQDSSQITAYTENFPAKSAFATDLPNSYNQTTPDIASAVMGDAQEYDMSADWSNDAASENLASRTSQASGFYDQATGDFDIQPVPQPRDVALQTSAVQVEEVLPATIAGKFESEIAQTSNSTVADLVSAEDDRHNKDWILADREEADDFDFFWDDEGVEDFSEIDQTADSNEFLDFEYLPHESARHETAMSDFDLEEAWNSATESSSRHPFKNRERASKRSDADAQNLLSSKRPEHPLVDASHDMAETPGDPEGTTYPALPVVTVEADREAALAQSSGLAPQLPAARTATEDNSAAEIARLKMALSEAINMARGLKVTDYVSGFTELQTTIMVASTVYLDQNSTLENIRDVTFRLASALEQLVEQPTMVPTLNSSITNLEVSSPSYFCLMDNDLISASYELNHYLATSASGNTETMLDLSNLEQISAHILALSEENYTQKSYTHLLATLSDAQSLVDDTEVTQDKIDAAVYELNLALSALQASRHHRRIQKTKVRVGIFGSLKAGAVAGISAYRHSRIGSPQNL